MLDSSRVKSNSANSKTNRKIEPVNLMAQSRRASMRLFVFTMGWFLFSSVFAIRAVEPVSYNVAEAQKVFDLANAGKNSESLALIGKMEKDGPIPWSLQAQKVYLLFNLNRIDEAQAYLDSLQPAEADKESWQLLQAEVAQRKRRYNEAYSGFHDLETASNPEVARQAREQLAYLPPVARQDRWLWGSLDGYGSYYGRYGAVFGGVNLKLGTYIPGARWLQPYASFTYIGDSRSSANGITGVSSIFSQNLAGVKGGLQAQPFTGINVTLYIEGGETKDLLTSTRHGGKWFGELQTGIRGYDSWGPGAVLEVPAKSAEPDSLILRLDWFTEFGGDFSYYSRIPNEIAYLQSKQGLRLLQFGNIGAWDVFVVENGSLDVLGSYYDNYGEVGPGTRLIFQPESGLTISVEADYISGAYMGRDDMNIRGGRNTYYDDVRVTAGVSLHW